MNTELTPDLPRTDATTTADRRISRMGNALLAGGAAVYAAAAVAPFTKGFALIEGGTNVNARGGAAYISAMDDPVAVVIRGAMVPGGLGSVVQLLSVLAMALVAVWSVRRLARGSTARPVLAAVSAVAVVVYMLATWTKVPSTPAGPGLLVLQPFGATASLVVASAASLAALVGALLAVARPRKAAD